jgi:hypothetical protein
MPIEIGLDSCSQLQRQFFEWIRYRVHFTGNVRDAVLLRPETKSGKALDEDAVRTRIKVGVPVHVHYMGEGDNILVDRVILDED